jgi:hypothetical protein
MRPSAAVQRKARLVPEAVSLDPTTSPWLLIA